MKPVLLKIAAFVFLSILTLSCNQTSTLEDESPWFSDDPLTIPQRIRLQKIARGNLVYNSSFEEGKVFSISDSLGYAFKINGWRRLGDNVEWVNTYIDSIYTSSEVNSGKHAIKIARSHADETETTGEGVLSDYIKVIPGKFSLSLYLRAQNIQAYQQRLGIRLNDAISIQLQYFDKNKIQLDGTQYIPHLSVDANVSMKSYPFAKHEEIAELPWCKIHARSHNNFQTEGTIPDNARYVKIFVGLKGTGTIWIDNIEYTYSNLNFSPLERFQHFTDTANSIYTSLVPQPKQIEVRSAILYFNNEEESPITINVPGNSNQALLSCANILKNFISKEIETNRGENYSIQIVRDASEKKLSKSALVFNLGKTGFYYKNTSKLSVNRIERLGDHAYFINNPSEYPNIIFLDGNSESALYYGIQTLKQLFDDKEFIYHNANIVDFPDVDMRHIIVQDNIIATQSNALAIIESLLQYKLSGFYLTSDNSSPMGDYKTAVKDLRKLLSQESMDDFVQFQLFLSKSPMCLLNTINTDSGKVLEEEQNFNHSELQQKIHYGLSNQVSEFAFHSYDIESDFNYHHGKKVNALFQRESNFISTVENNLPLSSYSIEYLPPWNNTQSILSSAGLAPYFYQNLIPKRLGILWTGNDKNSFYVETLDEIAITKLAKRPVVMLDNSLGTTLYSFELHANKPDIPIQRYKMLSLFEPYRNNYALTKDVISNMQKVVLNYCPKTELDVIRIATALDFLWNSADYNPDQSIWRVLVSRYGRGNAIRLIYFNDMYFAILGNMKKMELSPSHRLVKTISDQLVTIKMILDELSDSLGQSNMLVLELKELYKKQQTVNSKNEAEFLANQLTNAEN